MLELTEEQKLIVDTTRRIASERIAPRAAEMDASGEYPRELVELLMDIGLLKMSIPEEYGGFGYDLVTQCLVLEELSKIEMATPGIVAAASTHARIIRLMGTSEQQRKFYSRVTGEKCLTCFSMTEPEAGSDAGGMQARAVLQGDNYIINGRKCFATNGAVAGLYLIFASTEPARRGRGISAFIVEPDMPGFNVGKTEDKMGTRAVNVAELVLEDLCVPRENLLGEPGQGMKIALSAVNKARLDVGAEGVGLAQGALDYALNYAKQRVQFGKPIVEFQGVGFLLADMATQIEAARALTYKAAEMFDKDLPGIIKAAAMVKCFASDMAMRVTTDAVQVLGGYGYMKDHPLERMMRDAKVLQIYDGTNQIQRLVISRELVKA